MVGQLAGNPDDLHVADARAVHHGGGGLATGDAAAGGDPDIAVIGAGDAKLRIQAEEHGNSDQGEPEHHGIKVG
jgi:hypothetical protein